MEKDIWERVYFSDSYGKPYLFYVLFGTDNMDNVTVSKSKHNIDGMPDALEIINYSKIKDEKQKNYIEGFYDENRGKFLKEKNNVLYEKVATCNNVTVVKGEFEDTNSLRYLKNTIGIIQAIIETDITALLDLQIMEWLEPEEWSKKYFEPQAPNSLNQVKKLWSDWDTNIWLHTRGMRKFGRPDLSIRKITAEKKELGIEIINRFIQAFAYGLIPDETKEIWLKNREKGVYGKIRGNYDDLDFNNYYFEIDEI
ncbi:hypothetical protein ACYULU_02235 [Breznakiellaceae bacterium SP9]